ncbi:MAG: hypothetical protein N2C14_11065, partial [Planctomycetales bacterium]
MPDSSGPDSSGDSPTTKRGNPYRLLSLEPTPTLLCVPMALVGLAVLLHALTFEFLSYPWMQAKWPELRAAFAVHPLPLTFESWRVACAIAGLIMVLGALAGLLFRRGWALWVARKSCIAAYGLTLFYFFLVIGFTGQVAEALAAGP